MSLEATAAARLHRARIALEGLSVGDALGDQFFIYADVALNMIKNRALPKPVWLWSDDTNMALSIYEILRIHETLNADALAQSFALHYQMERGYGAAMHELLYLMKDNPEWRALAAGLFNGQGSYGNGAAMRVAPAGAYFADDLDLVVEAARITSEITHTHPEASAGAIAVAVATAYACRLGSSQEKPSRTEFINLILPHVPDSEVKNKIETALTFRRNVDIDHVAGMLGNGSLVSAQDTVPFVIWSAAGNLFNYEQAIWKTLEVLGDRDTTCAMVGGIVASYTGIEGIPAEWIHMREALPEWAV